MATLAARVLEHLRHDPDYAGAIAAALDAQVPVVHNVLARLRAGGEVRVAFTEETTRKGRPRIYYELGDGTSCPRAPGRTRPAPAESAPARGEVDVLDRLAAESRELRDIYGPIEFEALMVGNRGLGAS